jgi:hypothetical protein
VVGCSSADELPPEQRSSVEVRGDTTFVTIPAAWSPPTESAKVEIVLQGDALGLPTGIARAGERVVVADRIQLHVLQDDGSFVATTGGFGDAPGEFGNIMAIGSMGDTTMVLDYRLRRLSLLDLNGDHLAHARVLPVAPFVNRRPGDRDLQAFDGGVLYLSVENPRVNRPTRAAIVWSDFSGDSLRAVRAWAHIDWMHANGTVMPKQLFGPRAHISLGSGGLYAFGDGVEYCFSLERVEDPAVRRVCREWKRVPVPPSVSEPELTVFEYVDESVQRDFTNELEQMEVGEQWVAYDRLMLDEVDRVWVRRIGAEQAVSHPHLWNLAPELRPDAFAWDVYSQEGDLLRTVEFPGGFEPQLLEQGQAFGLWRLPDGEITVGKATW